MEKKLITLIVYNSNNYYNVVDEDDILEVHISNNIIENHLAFPGLGHMKIRVGKDIAKTVIHGSILVDGKLYTSIEENSLKIRINGKLRMQGIFSLS